MDLAQRNKITIRRLIEEIVNTGDVADLDRFVSPGCVATDGQVRLRCGVAGMADHIRAVRETYPDLHLAIGLQVAEGEWVATQITASGTHLGSWLGMEPTGQRLSFMGINLDRVVDGLIVEHAGAANTLEALLEIGALRPAAPAGDC